MLVFLSKLDALLLEVLQSSVYDFDAAINDKLSGIDLGLGLLDQEETLGDLGVVGDLHNLHLLDLDATHFHSAL